MQSRSKRQSTFFKHQTASPQGRKRLAVAIVVALALAHEARAQSVAWTGSANGDLANPANWQGGATPGSSASATFSGLLAMPLTLQNNQLAIKGLVFQPGASATTLTLSSSGSAPAALSVGASGISNLSSALQSILLGSANTTLNFSGTGSTISGAVAISNSTLLAQTNFTAGASAGSAAISNTSGGITEFNSASAGSASISNGGTSKVLFVNGATAENSVISIQALGAVAFNDTSTAANAHINNSGNVVFAGTSTAASSTIQNAGSLLVSNGASLGEATVTSSGSLNLSGTATAASASISNLGAATFTDATSAGQSLISNQAGATLTFQSTSSAGSSTITNVGALAFTGSSSAGTALITNEAGGTVTFAGTPAASTSRITNGGTLDVSGVQGGMSIGSLNGTGALVLGATQLTLGGLGLSDTLSGTISGSGGLTKTGSGTLTLSGAASYSGPTQVESGTLQLSGTLSSAISVGSGATLSGGGTTTGSVQVASSGVVSPGPTNTLHIDGNLSLAPGAVLAANITAAGGASRLAVGGNAVISGATLAVTAGGTPSSYLTSTVYTLLNANQGVTGTFQKTTSNLALLVPKVTYLPDAVTLSFTQLPVTNTGAGQGINSQIPSGSSTTGSGSMGDGGSTETLVSNLDTLTSNQLGTALGSLGASDYGTLRRLNLNESDQFAREVAAHNFSVDSGYGASSATGWLNFLTRRTSADALSGSLTDHDQGVIGGSDVYSDGTNRLAIAAQLLHSEINFGEGSNASTDRYDVGLVGTTRKEPWLFTGLLSVGHHSDDVNRFVDFGNYVEGPSSHPGGYNAVMYGETGAEIDEGLRTWMPYAALTLDMASDDSFQEGGGSASDLFGRARRANLLTSTLGIRVVQPIDNGTLSLGNQNRNWLSASLAWLHDSACTDGRVDASFLSDASDTVFSSTAPGFARDRVLASAEIHAEWEQHWQLQARLVGEAGASTRSIEGYTGLSYIW